MLHEDSRTNNQFHNFFFCYIYFHASYNLTKTQIVQSFETIDSLSDLAVNLNQSQSEKRSRDMFLIWSDNSHIYGSFQLLGRKQIQIQVNFWTKVNEHICQWQ